MKKPARNKRTWGGARAGAGRPAARAQPSEPHKTRPAIAHHHAVQVVARVAVPIARDTLDRALDLALARADFRIVYLAVRATRLELVVEATDKRALARGMQGFQVSAARSVNRRARRSGSVFPDRYRARVLASRPALAAVLARLPRAARERLAVPESPLFASGRSLKL